MMKDEEKECWRCEGKGWFEKSNRPGRKVTCSLCVRKRAKLAGKASLEQELRAKRKQFCVGVVGAGIGGFSTALALGRLGFKVVVLEKDSAFSERKQGYGLTLQQGFNAMKFLGLEIPSDTPSTSHFAFNSSGRILGYFGSEFSKYFEQGEEYSKKKKGKFNGQGRFNCHIPRQHLRYMLMDAIEKEKDTIDVEIRWGQHIESIEPVEETGQVKIHCKSSEPLVVDLLVGADGIYSTVRAAVLGDPLQFLNCVVVLGIAPVRHPLTHERVCETMDGVTRIYSMPFTSTQGKGIMTDPSLVEKDSIMWQLSFPVPDEAKAREICRSSETLKAEALRRCGGWHAPIPQLLAETSPQLLSGHPVYDRPELNPDVLQQALQAKRLANAVVLLGDAAHCMTPFKGQGANQALLDSTDLARILSRQDFFETRGACIEEFHRKMCARSASKVRGSREAAHLLHTPLATKAEQSPQEDELAKAGVSALTPENLNARVVEVCGFGHRPHTLHQVKIERSRATEREPIGQIIIDR